MSDKTGIEWADATWNPVRGCSLVSDGCKNCYAMGVAGRFGGPGQPYDGLTIKTIQGAKWTGKIMLVPSMLTQPIRWKRPRKIFVNSMSDLFHEAIPDSYIDQVFAAMALAPRHVFQVLTKRPARMLAYLTAKDRDEAIGWAESALYEEVGKLPSGAYQGPTHRRLPLPNVWLGVSVENQTTADERIPLLLQTPAAVRWLSMEPLLGPVDLESSLGGTEWIGGQRGCGGTHKGIGTPDCPREPHHHHDARCGRGIDWVVVGGESGPKARPMHPQWVRDLRDQCDAAGVPFLFKQWGEWGPHEARAGGDEGSDLRRGHVRYLQGDGREPDGHFRRGDAAVARTGKKTTGRTLDGQIHDGYPEITA